MCPETVDITEFLWIVLSNLSLTRQRNTVENKQSKISTREAHVFWRMLSDTYTVIDQINNAKSFVHDKDFILYLHKLVEDYEKEAREIEGILNKLSILGPTPNVRSQNVAGNSEINRDKETAKLIFTLMRLKINLLLQTIAEPYINDSLRSFIIGLTKDSLKRYDAFIKYLKAKKWIETPPQYPYTQTYVKDKIGAADIYLIWEHLMQRYNNIRQTQLLSSYTADTELKLLLDTGTNILKKEATDLENKLLYYGVTLPEPYTNIVPTPETTELMEDRYIFNTILMGMWNIITLHGMAIQDVIVNDSIRNYFINLTLDEIDLVGKMYKFGKLRGWVFVPPVYMFSSQ
ncbi:DUF3231 family protein [Sporotomaculum syntrophicum]|uniref:DUF3231 family protein n=1 Tax=Sporotomaculum syntrophicum TaxID=182264 RepID=UPI001FAD04FD|nr:DUF3231 family protein [Sporotomaculum syntrophicum]